MHNFKKGLRMILILCISGGILFALDFALYPCTFMRNDIHTVSTTQFDDIYMGTSHGKMDISPSEAQKVNGRTGHNVCVGGEYAVDTYYIARLMLEKGCKPSRIIYEVSPGYFTMEKEEGNNYLLFYHEFPLSRAKLDYFRDTLLKCNFRTMLFPWYEYPISYELSHLKENVRKKWSRDYDTEDLKSDTQIYHEDGFIERYPVDSASFTMDGLSEFHPEDVCETNMIYLEKLIDLCRENEITFVAVTTPLPRATLEHFADGYQAADEYFSAFFEEQGVPYVNFNNQKYFKTFTHKIENYTDFDGHMNGETAKAFSRLLEEVLERVCKS